MKIIDIILIILMILYIVSSFKLSNTILRSIVKQRRNQLLNKGGMLKLNLFKSFQPKPEPQTTPEVSKDLFVQYLPTKKKFNAIPGKSLIDYGKIMNAPIVPTSCRKGECRKCEVMIDNKVVLGCKVKIPTVEKYPSSKVFTITIPEVPGKKGVQRKTFD